MPTEVPHRPNHPPAAKLEEAPWDAIRPVVAMNSSGVATTVWIQPDNTLTRTYANRTTLAPAGAPDAPTGLSATPASTSREMTAAIDFAMSDLAGGSTSRRQPTKADHDLLLATYDPTMWL